MTYRLLPCLNRSIFTLPRQAARHFQNTARTLPDADATTLQNVVTTHFKTTTSHDERKSHKTRLVIDMLTFFTVRMAYLT